MTTCTLCGERMPRLNRYGECEECVEQADVGWLDYGGVFDGFTVTSDADPGL